MAKKYHQCVIKMYRNKDDDLLYWANNIAGSPQKVKENIKSIVMAKILGMKLHPHGIIPANFNKDSKDVVTCFYLEERNYQYLEEYRKNLCDLSGSFISMNTLIKELFRTALEYENNNRQNWSIGFVYGLMQTIPLHGISEQLTSEQPKSSSANMFFSSGIPLSGVADTPVITRNNGTGGPVKTNEVQDISTNMTDIKSSNELPQNSSDDNIIIHSSDEGAIQKVSTTEKKKLRSDKNLLRLARGNN